MASPATHLPVNPSSRAQAPQLTALQQAHANLVAQIASLRVPGFRNDADGEDLRNVADYLIDLANEVDGHIAAIYRVIKSNSTHSVDPASFDRPLFKALDGNALFEISEAADALDDDTGEVL